MMADTSGDIELKGYSHMPEACSRCKHFRSKPFVRRHLSIGYCNQADDGYTNDCLLESEEAKADEQKQG